MNACVVMTILARDQPGIVQKLSETVETNGGNWLESRMARLAGQFAGILRVECHQDDVDRLVAALEALEDMSIQIRHEDSPDDKDMDILVLDVVGNDRPGIVRALSSAIAGSGANLENLRTTLESAPMAGHALFRARGRVSLPPGVAPGAIVEAVESLGADLAVTVGE